MSTFTLSVIGLVLAIIANGWNVVVTFVRWPHVAVETQKHLYSASPGEPSRNKIVLTVINRGAEAVTISSIGLRADDGSFARDFQRDDAEYPDQLPESRNESLPLRVEGHGARTWTYGPKQLAEFRPGTVTGYVKVYESFPWFPWPRRRRQLTDRTIDAPRSEIIDLRESRVGRDSSGA